MATTPGIDKVLGTILIGTWLNSILYTLEFIAVVQYYLASKHNRDSHWLKGVVYFTLFVDTISTLANYSCVYFYSITHWGDPDYLGLGFWPSVVSLVTICVSETVVQLFLIYRYYWMSKNKYITPILVLFVMVELGSSIAAIHLFNTISFSERSKLVVSDIIWFSMSAAADISIALALIWQLSRIKSPFKSTQSLVHKLMATTIRTGMVTSVVVVVTLVLFLLDNESNASMTPGFCLGRVYALTMLYNLNNRSSGKSGSSNTNGRSGETTDRTSVFKSIHLHTTGLSTEHGPDLPDSHKVYVSTTVDETSDFPSKMEEDYV